VVNIDEVNRQNPRRGSAAIQKRGTIATRHSKLKQNRRPRACIAPPFAQSHGKYASKAMCQGVDGHRECCIMGSAK